MKLTPQSARRYLLLAAMCIALPSILSFYNGHTGKLLVTAPRIAGEPFEKTVIYLVRHRWFEAFGLIVNKPLTNEEIERLHLGQRLRAPAYYGGPVGFPSHAFILKQNSETGQLELYPKLEDRDKPANIKEIEAIIQNNKNVIVAFGYAGWGAFQLNYEIFKGYWSVIDYDPALIFDRPDYDILGEATQRLMEKNPPEDEKI